MNIIKIRVTVALAAMMVLCGCSDDIVPPVPQPDEGQPRDMFLCLHLTLSGGGVPGMAPDATRADAAVSNPDQGLTPSTPMENTAGTIALFVYDAVSNTLVDYVYLEGRQVAEVMSESGLLVPIYGTPGETVRIHAVVNPTQKIIDQFTKVDNILDITSVSDKTEYWDVMNELVPGTDGHQTALESNKTAGIPMTCEFNEPGRTDNIITLTGAMTEYTPLQVTAEATRIVAKLHVLATTTAEYTLTDGTKTRYVYAEDKTANVRELDNTDFANWIGWIRLSNVCYIPNAMNKSTYIFQHKDDVGNPVDLNMNMMDYAIGNRLYRLKYDKDFVYYYGEDLHNINISADGHMGHAEMFSAEKWNATKGNTDNANRYTQGMYCLENYFTLPTADEEQTVISTYTQNGFAIPIVTQITVAARLAPRNIVVAGSYAANMDNLVKEYKDNPSKFYRDYGLTPKDFGDEDVTLWENTLKDRYFKADANEIYRSEFYIIKALTEADAAHLINWSLMANGLWSGDPADFNNGKYPSGTYYVYDTKYDTRKDVVWKQRYLYLTAGAVNLATDENINIKTYSVPHISGWGYYFTYLDQSGTVSEKQIPYRKSQVTRNTYYLINIENFGSPGGTITHPEYIRVNTVPVNWTYGGRGDADLR